MVGQTLSRMRIHCRKMWSNTPFLVGKRNCAHWNSDFYSEIGDSYCIMYFKLSCFIFQAVCKILEHAIFSVIIQSTVVWSWKASFSFVHNNFQFNYICIVATFHLPLQSLLSGRTRYSGPKSAILASEVNGDYERGVWIKQLYWHKAFWAKRWFVGPVAFDCFGIFAYIYIYIYICLMIGACR